jgi:hypothetical protein
LLTQIETTPAVSLFFGDEIGLVFLRMPLPIHETAYAEFFLEIRDIIVRIGSKRYCIATAASTYKGDGTKKKEGDSGLLPKPPRWAANHFPTLVIEAGNTETYA